MPPVHFNGLRDFVVNRKALGGEIVCPVPSFYSPTNPIPDAYLYTKTRTWSAQFSGGVWSTTNMDGSGMGLQSSTEVLDFLYMKSYAAGKYQFDFSLPNSSYVEVGTDGAPISCNPSGLITSYTPSWTNSGTLSPSQFNTPFMSLDSACRFNSAARAAPPFRADSEYKYYRGDELGFSLQFKKSVLVLTTTGNCPFEFNTWEYGRGFPDDTATRKLCYDIPMNYFVQAGATSENITEKKSWFDMIKTSTAYENPTTYYAPKPYLSDGSPALPVGGFAHSDWATGLSFTISGNRATLYFNSDKTYQGENGAAYNSWRWNGRGGYNYKWYPDGSMAAGTCQYTDIGGLISTNPEIPQIPGAKCHHDYYCIKDKTKRLASGGGSDYDTIMASDGLEPFKLSSGGKIWTLVVDAVFELDASVKIYLMPLGSFSGEIYLDNESGNKTLYPSGAVASGYRFPRFGNHYHGPTKSPSPTGFFFPLAKNRKKPVLHGIYA